MGKLTDLAGGVFHWVLQTTWQAAVLAVLILLAQLFLRKRLRPSWRYGLWLLLVIRLVMPAMPPSAFSVFNLARVTPSRSKPDQVREPQINIVGTSPSSVENPVQVDKDIIFPRSPELPQREAAVVLPKAPFSIHWFDLAFCGWLAGVLFFGARLAWSNARFCSRIAGYQSIADEKVVALFNECRAALRIAQPVRLIESEEVESPAVYGLWRKWLLLPDGIFERFSAEELRFIFLHELAHIRRRDLGVNWLVAILQVLHWFNPVLWLAWGRMRADRELATDALALAHARESDHAPYGETILKVLEGLTSQRALPGLVGIVENKARLKERLIAIGRPGRPWKWAGLVAVLLIVGLGLTGAQTERENAGAPVPASAARPDLTGEVHLTNGQPVRATVFIDTAGPKTGTSPFCPSCYADCIKRATADAQGHFKIESLDPTLIFRILVVAKDCQPKYVGKVDPAKGPIKVRLTPQNLAAVPPEKTVHGRIVDSKGDPIEGAAIETSGYRTKDGRGMWGAVQGIDPLAVSDAQGRFVITARKAFATLDLKVEARGFARKNFTGVAGGNQTHEMVMTEGAEVFGRVMFHGKPLPGVSVGIVSTDRRMENFTGNYEVGTDAAGRFIFVNLPPNVKYTLYGIMSTLKKYGATALSQVAPGGDGSKFDAGDLMVKPAHRLAGQVVLNDGKPIPAKTRLLVGREDAWDTLQLTLGPDGHFDTAGIPSGPFSLSVRIPGYRVSARNLSLDTLNPFQISGPVDHDITNLVFLLEKGPDLEPNYDSPSDWPNKGPLRGAEGGPRAKADRTQNWQISGRVTDAKTGKPLASFTVTPGDTQYSHIQLAQRNRVEGSNGVYTVELSRRFAEPVFKVEAPGYLPEAVTPPQEDRTNFDLTLQPGAGPSGMVFLPDGKPAGHVTVGLICAHEQGVALQGDTISSWRNKVLKQTTDANGHFSFAPQLEMKQVAAANAEGFKLISVAELATNPKMVLEPWGHVKGTLHRPSGPGANEDLDLAFSSETLADPWSFQTGSHAITDDQGQFEFDRVPPGKLDLTYQVKQSENGWMSSPLQSITVAPGQTLELKINAPARVMRESPFHNPQPMAVRKPGPPLTGTVLLPDGKPAAGAQVAVIVPNVYLSLKKATLEIGADSSILTVTDSKGHFSLPNMEGANGIVAVAETGFAQYTLPQTNSLTLTLQPWGEIHGTLHVGRRLGTNQSVRVRPPYSKAVIMYSFNDFKAQTDDQGRFVITYVPPGALSLIRLVRYGNGWSDGATIPIEVKAGGVTEISMGGVGREVEGKAVFSNPADALDWKEVYFSLVNSKPGRMAPVKFGYYQADYSSNGFFRFEDVLPGTYTLSAQSRGEPGHLNFSQPLGSKQITVPAGSSNDADALNVGTLEVSPAHAFKVGDPASAFEVETLDGRKLHLADYRGKYVLLNFNFPPMGIPPNDLASLKDVFQSLGKEPRLAMLGISYATSKMAKEFARTNGINWTQAAAIFPVTGMEFRDYFQSMDSWPGHAIFLIDPSGKIVDKGLGGAEVKNALAKALAK